MLSVVNAVTMAWLVVEMVLSRSITDPTVWFEGEFDIFSATAQLLTLTDFKVQAQFQFMKMAVLQPLKVKLRVVNCWLPRNIP
jgi:hypothetical protein